MYLLSADGAKALQAIFRFKLWMAPVELLRPLTPRIWRKFFGQIVVTLVCSPSKIYTNLVT